VVSVTTKFEPWIAQSQTVGFAAIDADSAINLFDADVIVVGAGFAGVLIALLVARQGRSTLVIDPHTTHPGDFRCEKLSLGQAQWIADLGVGDAFGLAPGADPLELTRRGFAYGDIVNGLRALWPAAVTRIGGKAISIAPSPDRRLVTLSDGRTLAAKLVVLATGLGERLRSDLGLTRRVLSPAHSVSIGLTLEAPAARREALLGLVQPGERLGDGVGYASFFPFGSAVRMNLFLYDAPMSERVARFRSDPMGELFRALPSLAEKLEGARPVSPVQLRIVDLYAVERPARDGVVLVGDARRTSCPASGTGVSRILQDAKLLTATHLPAWFEANRFDAARIAAFYAEPELTALDQDAHKRSMNGRLVATKRSAYWRLRRLAKLALESFLRRSTRSAQIKSAPTQILGAFSDRKTGSTFADTLGRFQRVQPPAPPALPTHGERVVVRSAQEILATLDADGRLDAMPFMPEMIAYIGREMQVARRIQRTCVEGPGLRRLDDAVALESGALESGALEAARCDGAMHDGCQRGCMIFWKAAWLRPADQAVKIDPIAEADAIKRLAAFRTRIGDAYTCQSTQLEAATHTLPDLHIEQLMREVQDGDLRASGLARIVVRAIVNRLRAAVGLAELGLIVGATVKASKGELGLTVGDWVRIKSQEEVRAALDPRSRNRGLTFEPEMTRYIGSVHRVAQVVERIIDERNGKMVSLDRTVVLDQVYCEGLCNKACPRKNPLFWREAWLERVEAPT
jgi:2-polyprenyl-6-methoxyphenol hydroxylase-like FAD-dependent oxidoreductase